MDNYLVRLQEYIDYKELNNKDVEAVMGVSTGVIRRNIKLGSDINAGAIEKFLLHYKDISAEWLMTGRGQMILKEVNRFDSERMKELEKETQRLDEELNALKVKYNRNNEKLIIAQGQVIGMQEEINKIKKQK